LGVEPYYPSNKTTSSGPRTQKGGFPHDKGEIALLEYDVICF